MVEFAKLSVLINIYIYTIYTYIIHSIYTKPPPPFSIHSRSPERRTINHFIIVINDLGVVGCFHTIKPEQRLNSYTLGCLRPFYTLILAQLSFPRLLLSFFLFFFFVVVISIYYCFFMCIYSHCFLSANVILFIFYFIISFYSDATG